VLWNDGTGTRIWDRSLAVRTPTGEWILKANNSANAPCIITASHGVVTVTLANCFPMSGPVTVSDLEIRWPNGATTKRKPFSLDPGQGITFEWCSDASRFPDPGTIHPAAVPVLDKWFSVAADLEEGGFTAIGESFVWGPKKGNEGSSEAGIYAAGMDKLLGNSTGVFMAHQAGRGGAHRQRMWRFDREAWIEGRLEPAKIKGFEGFDKTRSVGLFGFDGKAGGIAGFDQFNSNHLGRLGNWLGFAAKHGIAWDRFALRVLADEVRLGWCDLSSKAEKLLKKGDSWCFDWFGCNEILDHYPAGQGCFLLGRGFAHDLLVLVNAERAWPGRYTADLELMAATIKHCWYEEEGCVYLIPALDPILHQKVSAWKKKVGIDQDTIPPDVYPAVARAFEASLLQWSMEQLSELWLIGGVRELAHIVATHGWRIRNYPYELRVIGHEDWSDKDQALGSLALQGEAGDRWLGDKTLEQLLNDKKPWADNPLYACPNEHPIWR
jgi:hypothetical protein